MKKEREKDEKKEERRMKKEREKDEKRKRER